MKRLLSTVLVVLLLGAGAVEAAGTKRGSSKAAGTTTAKKKGSSKRSSVSKRRSTSRASPRPTRPTPERYREIQQALADKGFYDGPIDGVWGAECVIALKQFQESEGLSVDGKLGARSIIALGLGPQRSADSQFLVKPPADTDDEP